MDNEMNNVTNDIFEEEVNLTRSESREQAFMLLFSKSFDDEPLEETIDDNSEMFVGGVCAYAQAVVSGIEDKHEEIDEIIASHLKKGWTLSRISKPSLAILRLAIYEMKYLDNVPQSVSINEAVELAKKYTIDESKFVNGILGTYSREISGKSEK
ncbi:transcription antitermination factor NusB [Ruminococcus sp. TF12-19AC]|jgi:N utilization substance protein B|nr:MULTISPECIES: transcription antitermination factor NusB [unclassified Ruminococcus]RGH61720.1 transcription antitermination factor NusB [Ruminococcus sp. AM34-10LB]RGI08678.1 transcription antitermination factor NusB [Ruminococcus sp. TF12-19AC]